MYDFIKDFSPVFVAIVALFVPIYQAQRERRANFKKEHQIKIFEQLLSVSNTLTSICDVLSLNALMWQVRKADEKEVDINKRIDSAMQLEHATNLFCKELECHEILNPLLFRTTRFMIQAKLYELSRDQPYLEREVYFSRLEWVAREIACFTRDIISCLQNEIYGELFSTKVLPRETTIDSLKVIKNEPDELYKLLEYVQCKTAYGKEVLKVN
ncbi:hypothetical protein [Aeromonas enteropelogenes]|uniref:hypothetical protein n=1 Tax=Aeromonas enteropelogenes TaxID=29489 RepID=UPI002286B043|nr:hypothetical protein [Aeromonas enteropelogenes]MCZ0751749.1 hypothetical protein [Aeromonas enteropelogenes]